MMQAVPERLSHDYLTTVRMRSAAEAHDVEGVVANLAEGQIDIASRRLENGIVLVVSGEVNLVTAPRVEHELLQAEASHDLVVLDLSRITFMGLDGTSHDDRRQPPIARTRRPSTGSPSSAADPSAIRAHPRGRSCGACRGRG
jgi:hypothetical protein